MDQSQMGVRELRGIHIDRYKNLKNIWLPWSDGLALFGMNGVGKTNTLEALAILMGTDQTLALATERLVPVNAGDLAVVASGLPQDLPWAPGTVLALDPEKILRENWTGAFPVLGRVVAEAKWWQAIGVRSGDSFIDGLSRLPLPDAVLDYLQRC